MEYIDILHLRSHFAPIIILHKAKICNTLALNSTEILQCIGAVHTEFESNGRKTKEWHYYISSRNLTAKELLHHARMEWSVETMHWLLDVHFEEDYCRVEDKTVQKNLNMFRKLAINLIKRYKERSESKRAISKSMFDCLLDPSFICNVIFEN